MHLPRSLLSLLICWALLFSALFFYFPKWKNNFTEATISWDVSGYYYYLPAAFIYKDLKHLAFKDQIQQQYRPSGDFQQAFIHTNGNYVFKYSCGQALLYTPFFFIAHAYASMSDQFPADGFSLPYQFMISFGSLLVAFLGLWVLRKVLLKFFSDQTTALTLILLVFGTNYLEYASITGAMNHNYLFTLYCFLLALTIGFYEKPSALKAAGIGLVVGFAALVRPTELISALIPILWGLKTPIWASLGEKLVFFKKNAFNASTFCALFIVKLCFGICFYLVYTAYYKDQQTSDMHKYYHDAVKIFELTKNKPLSYFSILSGLEMYDNEERVTQQLNFWYQEESASVINDSRMVIRFNLLLLPLSRGNIYIHLVTMVFLSFIGLSLIYLSLEKHFFKHEFLLLISCFGIPSVMFWSSGIMKEGLLLFFFGILVYNLFKNQSMSIYKWLLISLSFAGMFYSKFYVAFALIPSLLFLFICFILKSKSYAYKLMLTLILVILLGFSFNLLLHNTPLEKLSKKQNDFINLSIGGVYLKNNDYPFDTIFTLNSHSLETEPIIIEGKTAQLKTGTVYHHWKNPGYADTLVAANNQTKYTILKILAPTGSAITLQRLMPKFSSVIKLFPEAFLNVSFRPFFTDIENTFSFLAALENIILICLMITMIFYFKKPNKESQKLIIFSLLFVFTLYTLVGLTTPVLGAAVRYKVPALPFLILSLFLFYDIQKLENKIQGWRKK